MLNRNPALDPYSSAYITQDTSITSPHHLPFHRYNLCYHLAHLSPHPGLRDRQPVGSVLPTICPGGKAAGRGLASRSAWQAPRHADRLLPGCSGHLLLLAGGSLEVRRGCVLNMCCVVLVILSLSYLCLSNQVLSHTCRS